MSERWKVSTKRLEMPKSPQRGLKWERRPGGWWVARTPEGRQIRTIAFEGKGRLAVLMDGLAYSGELQQEARGGSAGGGGDSDLTAQFPGKVRKLLVAEGTEVKEGEPLLLVEAMKMEFAVRAPSAGRVAKWKVQEGQQLSPGDLFLDWEASGGE